MDDWLIYTIPESTDHAGASLSMLPLRNAHWSEANGYRDLEWQKGNLENQGETPFGFCTVKSRYMLLVICIEIGGFLYMLFGICIEIGSFLYIFSVKV